MTLDELQHIFRFQLTEDENYKPTGTLEYWTFNGQDRVPGRIATAEMDKLVDLLEGYNFEGYRDRTPLFLKPEADL